MLSPPAPIHWLATLDVVASMRVRGFLAMVAQTEPKPKVISPPGPVMFAAMVASLWFVLVLTRVMVPSP